MANGNGIGGYAGKILRVDLTSERITEEILDKETLRKYVGGTALGAKYLYEEVPPAVEWSDPENRIMFFTGPLTGTRVGSGIFSVISKGATTGLAGTSQANGFFGAFLKFAGFDGIIVQGRAKKWSYLYIHDNTAEIRSAEDLAGEDTWETEDAIKKGLKRQSSVYSIGPAGENLVRFACIVGDHGHVVAHSGLGAVMGSKKLKAVVAERMQRSIKVVDPGRLAKLAKSMYETALKAMPTLPSGGTAAGYPILYRGGQLPVKNYTTNIFPEFEKFGPDYLRTHFKVSQTTCWGCRIAHCRMTEVTEGPYNGYVGEEPEYEALAGMSAAIGNTDPGSTVMLGNETDRLGMDVNESSYTIAWMMECYEKGLLGKNAFDGLEMTWGNVEATLAMLKKIAYRQGSGDIFADGLKRVAERFGGEAQKCAVYTLKAASPRGHDHRARWMELIDTCTSNTGTIEVGPGVPFIKELGQPPLKDPFDAMEVSTMNAMVNGRRIFEDSLVVCILTSHDFQMEVDALNAVTGLDYSLQEAFDVGRRAVNQLRVFNFRNGLTKEAETPSLRYASVPVDGPQAGKTIMPQWEALRSNYYKNMGWNPETGKPLPETLEKLGLAHLVADLNKI
ncbi:MAG TPA: aldehyde ferredoxin oxidoreductase C-terminal domain-containing protein [Acidobacteriota bacterium]|nr:aldehyde ferredoxin oxidoreductase C-terminal domain-containing protein [Acidobacteriota bacterium]